jgi:hypothetical protein
MLLEKGEEHTDHEGPTDREEGANDKEMAKKIWN